MHNSSKDQLWLSYLKITILKMKLKLARIKHRCLLLVILLNGSAFSACASQDSVVYQTLSSGKNLVQVSKYTFQGKQQSFIVLHDNERTGFNAALKYCRNYGGTIYKIENNQQRFLMFAFEQKRFMFDPNQIFNKMALSLNASKLNKCKPVKSFLDSTSGFATNLLKIFKIDSAKCVITLHNNTDGAFSILDYLPGHILSSIAKEVYFRPGTDPDDFLLVTEKPFFDYLSAHEINVILQDSMAPTDGSLSIYAQLNRMPYINIEIQHGHEDIHYKYIELVSKMLDELGYNENDEFAPQEKSSVHEG